MLQIINSERIQSVEEMRTEYVDAFLLYEFIPSDTGYYMGKLLAISDKTDYDKLKAMKDREHQNGTDAIISRPNMPGIIRSTRRVEVY